MRNDKEILEELQNKLSEAFNSFADARLYLEHGSVVMKQIRMYMSLRNVHDAIIDDDLGDMYFDTEQQLSKVEKDSLLLRTYLLELEKAQMKKGTKNKVLNYDVPDHLH